MVNSQGNDLTISIDDCSWESQLNFFQKLVIKNEYPKKQR